MLELNLKRTLSELWQHLNSNCGVSLLIEYFFQFWAHEYKTNCFGSFRMESETLSDWSASLDSYSLRELSSQHRATGPSKWTIFVHSVGKYGQKP